MSAPLRGSERRLGVVLPLIVLAVLIAGSIAAFVAARRLVDNQEDRLLSERSDEISLLVSSSISTTEAALGVLASVAASGTSEAIAAFGDGASRLADGTSTVYAAQRSDAGPEVIATVGPGVAVDDALTGEIAALFDRASGTDGLVPALVDDGGERRLLLALAVDDVVAFQQSTVDPERAVPASADSPFSDVRVALYASDDVDPDALVLTTEADVPLQGEVRRDPVEIGTETWTLAVGARDTLVGDFARQVPWLLLGAGLLSASLATVVTGVLARRRTYALDMVAARTVDLRQAQEAAEAANRSKSEFLSRMSHELRTPLNAVIGFGQLLEMDTTLTADQRDEVRHILKAGQHLLQLINEVLDISRVEAGNIPLSPEAVLVGDLLTDSLDLIRPLADQRGIQLATDRTDGWDCHVFADRQRTKQVLLNLLSNAVKYNRQRGTVAVSCTVAPDGRARILVSDTGPGIRPEQLDLVFLPFERLGAEQGDVEGSGIGLALSKRLAEAMGGKLGVDSTPGVGTTFWLELPLVENPVGRYERLNGAVEERPADPVPVPVRRTVLHIEDNLSNLKLVERILAQRPDIEIVAAMQGRLGVELAHEHRPLLVLLDLHLPDMNGEQVLERLRDDPVTAGIPVVIVSADATPGQVQRLLAAGAAGYLTKPIDVRELLRVLDDVLVVP